MEASQTDLTMILKSTTPTLELQVITNLVIYLFKLIFVESNLIFIKNLVQGFHFLSTVESKQLIQPTLCLLMSSTGSSSTNEGR